MKTYKKSKLSYVNGMLVTKKGKVVYPGSDVVRQANELEKMMQEYEYLKAQPEFQPKPSLEGFKRVHERENLGKFHTLTPTLDSEVKKTLALLRELDEKNDMDKANDEMAKHKELIDFLNSDVVVGLEADDIELFDTPTLGDVLTWDENMVARCIAKILGYEKHSEPADEIAEVTC